MTKYTIIYYRESELTVNSTVVYSGFDKDFAKKVFDHYVHIKGYTTVSEEYYTTTNELTDMDPDKNAFTGIEKHIFKAAIERERDLCTTTDTEWERCGYDSHVIDLEEVCNNIERKVKQLLF